jgi:hypothetical protein
VDVVGSDVKRQRLALTTAVGVVFVVTAMTGLGGHLVRAWFLPVLALTGAVVVACAPEAARRATATGALALLLPLGAWCGVAGQQPDVAAAPPLLAADGASLGSRLGDGTNPLLSGAGGEVTVLQVLLAATELGPAALDGRGVVVTGVSDGRSSISRLAMACCIADARRVPLTVRGPLPASGTWVRVTGRLRAQGGRVVLVDDRVQTVPAPDRAVL